MVNDIVHTAIARKMLCSPVNSLIADTEFSCAAGMVLKLIKADGRKALEAATVRELLWWLLQTYEGELEGDFDTPYKNLITMIKNYRAEDTPFTESLKELLILGFEKDIVYPKGRFL